MSRPARFPVKLEFWTNEQQLEGLDLACSDGLSDRATHLRQALAMYLRAAGIVVAPRPQPNGHPQQEQAHHGV
jgi:hypothetical protein